MTKFLFKHFKNYPSKGFAIGIADRELFGLRTFGLWFGYGKPIWIKPKILYEFNKGKIKIGFGWFYWCVQLQTVN